jgi:hypothetical protein
MRLPWVFTRFLSYDYQPPAETTPFQFPNMTRMTYTPATGLYIIQNVAQIYINFTSNTVTTGTGGKRLSGLLGDRHLRDALRRSGVPADRDHQHAAQRLSGCGGQF